MHTDAPFPGPHAQPAAVRRIPASGHVRLVASRRSFLGAALASAASTVPVGGVFAAGDLRLRVGLVGCGGRGTGAALQAAVADPAVRVVALGDLFADQVASTADVLAAGIGPQFDCPQPRRFVGDRCFRGVIDSDVDVVLLAAPPHVRPQHLEAAVAAGRHVYCEKPVAIDVPGVLRAAAAAARSRDTGLSLVSGFCFRRDEAVREMVARVHAGEIGRPLALHAHAAIGLPWRKPRCSGAAEAAFRQRNWISFAGFSGGHFVEHHVEAIDRAVWMLGDTAPLVAEPAPLVGGDAPAGSFGDCSAGTAVRYRFADGAVLEASVDRRERQRDFVEERVCGSAGSCDLVRGMVGGAVMPRRPGGAGRYHNAMAALVRGVLAGRPVHDGQTMCLSTMVAVMGRMAGDAGRGIGWSEVVADASFLA